MEKPAKIAVKGSVIPLNPALEDAIETRYTLGGINVQVICVIDAVFKVIGAVTGNEYTFSGGTPVDVDDRDVDELLEKKRKNACCGGTDVSIFQLVE